MLKRVAQPAFLFLILFFFGVRPVLADIYKYVNEQGEVNFADNLESVPEKFRATAVNTTTLEEQKELRAQAQHPAEPQTLTELSGTIMPQPNVAATQVAPGGEPAQATTFTTRILMTAGVVFGLFGILFAIGKLGDFQEREKVLLTVRVALACIFLIYLVVVHGKDTVFLFTMAKNEIRAVQEKQAERGRKAGQAIKALNRLMEEAAKQPPMPDPSEEKGQ